MRPAGRIITIAVLATLAACSGPPDRFAETQVDLLVPGYTRVYAQMQEFGCTPCHTTGPQKIVNPLRPPAPDVDARAGTRALTRRLDQPDLEQCRLVRKPAAEIPHKGGRILDAEKRQLWLHTLRQWLAPLQQQKGA